MCIRDRLHSIRVIDSAARRARHFAHGQGRCGVCACVWGGGCEAGDGGGEEGGETGAWCIRHTICHLAESGPAEQVQQLWAGIADLAWTPPTPPPPHPPTHRSPLPPTSTIITNTNTTSTSAQCFLVPVACICPVITFFFFVFFKLLVLFALTVWCVCVLHLLPSICGLRGQS